MKVAVLFAGRVKGYEKGLSKLLGFKTRYTPTYYCSLNEPEYTDEIDKFCKLFDISPERIHIESTPDPGFFHGIRCYTSKSPKQAYSMFFHENKAFSLIEKDVIQNNIHYDCVLYCRADIISRDTLELVIPVPNTIYVPDGEDFFGVNDRLAYGDYNTMKKYCSVIHDLTSAQSMNGTNPEGILKRHLEKQLLDFVRFRYDTNLSNLRKMEGDR